GYVLPWGNMSFWGAKVIITLFSAIPVVGNTLVSWIMGTVGSGGIFVPGDPTLNRFFALHVVALPLVLLLLVVLHLGALHEVGSNNPDGVEIKKHKGPDGHPLDGIPFHPYYTLKDLVGVGGFLIICAIIIFVEPTVGGFFLEPDNLIKASPLVTPATIKPVWYFSPFYAILRAIPDKGLGVLALLASIVALFLVPWLDRGKVKSIRYRGIGYKVALTIFAITFLLLGSIGADVMPTWLGYIFGNNPEAVVSTNLLIARILTIVYFAFFVFLWVYTFFGWEKTKPVPERVTTHA
ncbi:MAG: cytochrome b, partial [Rhodanobacteraceae bacterium]